LEIGNGRIQGDEDGAITFIQSAGKGKSVVDLLIYSPAAIGDIKRFSILHWSHTNHFPLLLELNTHSEIKRSSEQITVRERITAPSDKESRAAFSSELDALVDSYEPSDDVEADFSALKNFVHATCKKHNLHKKQSTFAPKAKWFDKECLALKQKKDRALRALKRAYSDTILDELIVAYKDCNKAFKCRCKERRDDFNLKLQLSLLNHKKSGTFWAAVRAARDKLRTSAQIPKAAWMSHFSKVYASNERYSPFFLPEHPI